MTVGASRAVVSHQFASLSVESVQCDGCAHLISLAFACPTTEVAYKTKFASGTAPDAGEVLLCVANLVFAAQSPLREEANAAALTAAILEAL